MAEESKLAEGEVVVDYEPDSRNKTPGQSDGATDLDAASNPGRDTQ